MFLICVYSNLVSRSSRFGCWNQDNPHSPLLTNTTSLHDVLDGIYEAEVGIDVPVRTIVLDQSCIKVKHIQWGPPNSAWGLFLIAHFTTSGYIYWTHLENTQILENKTFLEDYTLLEDRAIHSWKTEPSPQMANINHARKIYQRKFESWQTHHIAQSVDTRVSSKPWKYEGSLCP